MYFNQKFSISAIQMRRLGVFNLELGSDNKMFVDSKLLEGAKEEFAGAHSKLLAYFAATVQLINYPRNPATCLRLRHAEVP